MGLQLAHIQQDPAPLLDLYETILVQHNFSVRLVLAFINGMPLWAHCSPIVSLYRTTVSFYGATVSLYGTTVSLYGATVSLYGATVTFMGLLLACFMGPWLALWGHCQPLWGHCQPLWGYCQPYEAIIGGLVRESGGGRAQIGAVRGGSGGG